MAALGRAGAEGHVEVRQAADGDVSALVRLIADMGYDVTESDVAKRLATLPESHVVLVADDDAILGYVHVYVDPSLITGRRAQLGGFSVADGHRRRGVGETLLARAEAWARQQGCTTVWVRSGSEREGAHRFYERRGYDYVKPQQVFSKRLDIGDA